MKRVLWSAMSCMFWTLCSCDSNIPITGSQVKDVECVSVVLERMESEEPMSRLMTDGDVSGFFWEKNDTLGIFPTSGGQVEFAITEEEVGGSSASFGGGGWGLKGGYKYSAYYPFNFYNRNSREIPFSYVGQQQTGNNNQEHLRDYLFFACAPTEVQNGKLNFKMYHEGSVLKLTLTMPVAKTWSTLSVYTDAEILPVKKVINLQEVSLPQTTIAYSDRVTMELKNIVTTAVNQEIIVWLAFPSVAEGTHPLKVMVRDSEGYAYVANILKSSDKTQAYASFTKNKWQKRIASPKLSEGMNSGISDWEASGEDYGGTVN